MYYRFKTDLKEHQQLNAPKTLKIPSKTSTYIKEANDGTNDRELKKAFKKYMENNIKNVRYNLDESPIEVRAGEWIRTYKDKFNKYEGRQTIFENQLPKMVSKKNKPRKLSSLTKLNDLDNFQDLIHRVKQFPKYSFREGESEDTDYYGKAFSYFQYWISDIPGLNPDRGHTALFYDSLRRQRDFTVSSTQFEHGFQEKARIVDNLIEEESKKFAQEAGLSPFTEKRLKKELKGSRGLRTNSKWYERVHRRTKPHHEVHVRECLKPLMKNGMPSSNTIYHSSKVRFYNRIYLGVLEGCCNYFRGRYLEEDKKLRKQFASFTKKISSLEESEKVLQKMTYYARWLFYFNFSHAICTYSREMQISFNDFNMLPNSMFRAAMKSCLHEYRNLVVKRYSKEPRHKSQFKLGWIKIGLEDKLCKSMPMVQFAMTTGCRIPVSKNAPYLSYNKHLENAYKRRFTLCSDYVARKYKQSKVQIRTVRRFGRVEKQSQMKILDINRKRLVLSGKCPASIFNNLHSKFSKEEGTRQRRDRTKQLYDARESPTNSQMKIDGSFQTSSKGLNSPISSKDSPMSRINCREEVPLKEVAIEYKTRNYSRIFNGEMFIKPIVESQLLSRDPFFFRSQLGTQYAINRYKSQANKHYEVYRKIKESTHYNLGYMSELFYWIRAYFEEYNRIKKGYSPLSYSFRNKYCPDPYIHFSPITKTPNLDWLILKLQDNERITKTLTYDFVVPMKKEIIRKCKTCIDHKANYSRGANYFKNIGQIKPFKGLPCKSCYPDFQGTFNVSDEKTKMSARYKEKLQNEKPFTRICCGLIENSEGVRSENVANTLSVLQDEPKVFNQVLKTLMDETRVLGNIQRTKQAKVKECVLEPIISASKDFFWKYFGEYLCLFTKEQTALGSFYNYKVVKRLQEYHSWTTFSELMLDVLGKVDSDIIKVGGYVPRGAMKRLVESESFPVTGFKGLRKKYYSEVAEQFLTHEYSFHKYKDFSSSELDTIIDYDCYEELEDILKNSEAFSNQEYADKRFGDDVMQEKVLQKLIMQDSDDTEWTIYDHGKLTEGNLKKKDEIVNESVLPDFTSSETSLVEYVSDLQLIAPKVNPVSEEDAGSLRSGGTKFVISSESNPVSLVGANDGQLSLEQTTVSFAFTDLEYSHDQNYHFPSKSTPFNERSISNVKETPISLPKSDEQRIGSQALASEGENFRRMFAFQDCKDCTEFLNLTCSSTHEVPKRQSFHEVIDSGDDEDSIPLTYSEVLRQNASKSDLNYEGESEKNVSPFSEGFLSSDYASVISDFQSVSIPYRGDEYDYEHYGNDRDRLKNIWFYDHLGKIRKHVKRRERMIDVKGEKRFPAECALITQWYYMELSNNLAKKKVMHLMLNCWNNHQKKWLKRLDEECKSLRRGNKKNKREQSVKEKVFWSNRKINIDDNFKKELFKPTVQDSYHREFYKSQYNAVQSWLHKTTVTPNVSELGWFVDKKRREEKKLKSLEKRAKQYAGNNPADIHDAINKIRDYQMKWYGSELNACSMVWDVFWSNWKQGTCSDVLDSKIMHAGESEIVDSDDESIGGADFVLGFPPYLSSEDNPLQKFVSQYETYNTNKRFYNEIVKELAETVNKEDITQDQFKI